MNKKNNDQIKSNELWFNWLSRKLNSCESLDEVILGKAPEEVAELFISANENSISEVFKKFDEEDRDTLEHFQKLTECEWHVFRILKDKLKSRNKILFVDFKKNKKKDD